MHDTKLAIKIEVSKLLKLMLFFSVVKCKTSILIKCTHD